MSRFSVPDLLRIRCRRAVTFRWAICGHPCTSRLAILPPPPLLRNRRPRAAASRQVNRDRVIQDEFFVWAISSCGGPASSSSATGGQFQRDNSRPIMQTESSYGFSKSGHRLHRRRRAATCSRATGGRYSESSPGIDFRSPICAVVAVSGRSQSVGHYFPVMRAKPFRRFPVSALLSRRSLRVATSCWITGCR